MEMSASLVRLDAVRLIKTVLAGTPTQHFSDVMQAAFGGAQEKTRQTDEDPPSSQTTSEASSISSEPLGSQKRPASDRLESESKKAKAHPTKGICSLADAQIILPRVSDQKRYLHVGVEERFISDRVSSVFVKDAGYHCLYSSVQKEEGNIIKSCDAFSTVKAQMSTHIRQMHLGIAVACFICNKKWWSSSSWWTHMQKAHSQLKEEEYFVADGADIEGFREFIIKKEVSASEIQ